VILFEDEASLSNTATVGYAWAEKGKQPLIPMKQRQKERLTLFGSVNVIDGEVMVKMAEQGNAQTFKRYLKYLLGHFRDKKILMILDNVRYHHAKRLKSFLERFVNRLELVFLPPYSPDFNPMERVWWYMRKSITHNRACHTMKERKIAFWKLFSGFQKPNNFILDLCNITLSV